jgi:hypothetical protein
MLVPAVSIKIYSLPAIRRSGRSLTSPKPEQVVDRAIDGADTNQINGGNVSRPRVADDFVMIRARMEELRRERARPRAADDFTTIRARMEELRRERAQASSSRSRCRPSVKVDSSSRT